MKFKLLLASLTILNFAAGKTASAQANFGNQPLDVDRAPQSQIIKDFNRLVELEIKRLEDTDDSLAISRDYEHLESNIDLFKHNVRSKDKAKNSTIFYLDRNPKFIFEQNRDWDETITDYQQLQNLKLSADKLFD